MYFKTIEEFNSDNSKKLIYDLRKEKDYNNETIPGAVHLPWEKLEAAVKADELSFLPKDLTVYIFCYTDKKADDLAIAIREKGYENVYSISGGYSSYARFKLNGLVTNEALGRDDMYENAAMHDAGGAWQMIFGVNTMPAYRKHGCAAQVMERVIADARAQGRRGCVLTCKDKLVHYYEKFGFQNEGVSQATHGGAVWYDMRLTF